MDFKSLSNPLPSLDWTLWKLTGVWAQEGEMVSCPLPGHTDSTPSFNLWRGDAEQLRFGCFGCGRRGNVLDLIDWLEFSGSDDTEAIIRRAGELAVEEAEDTTPRERHTPEEKPVRHLPNVLQEMQDAFGPRELGVLQKYMAAKGMAGEEREQYAQEEWGWTVGTGRAVAVPHRDRSGDLIGIHYRTTERKWTEPGSKFTALYGAWRDRGYPAVLCEGETDTLWAASSLRGQEIDVLGLPSGVSQSIREEWLEQLKDRELTLAFDQDEAGMAGARAWAAARPDALLARLPEGEDLLSCGVPVVELLERARVPRHDGGLVTEVGGVFAKKSSNALVPIADFAVEPVRELYTDEGPAWEVRVSGDRRETIIRAADLHSNASITRWANRNGRSWLGTGTAVQGVFNWLSARSAFLPLERAVTRAGKIGRSYVGPGFCIGPDRIRYIPPALGDAKLASRLHIKEGGWDPKAILALEQLNDPAVMSAIIGWTCASLIRGQRAPAPPLFISGESGAGKTQMLSAYLSALGYTAEVNLTTTTPYGVDCMINSCVGFPTWFDEYRGGAREDSMSRLGQMLRDAFNGQPSMKGGMTQQATELTEVSTWAGIVVSGEMSSQETSIRDRALMIDLDPNDKNEKALEWLQGDRRRTDGLGHALLAFLAQRDDALFRVGALGDMALPPRYRQVLSYVDQGWRAWREFRWVAGLHESPTDPDIAALSAGRVQSEDPWLEALRACEGVMCRSTSDHIVHDNGDGSYTIIPSEVVIEAKRVGIELPARANELVTWLKRRHDVEDTRVGTRRAKRVKGLVL